MNKKSSSFKVLISAMLVPLCFYAQNDWDAVPIAPDAGVGNQWVLDAEASDDFNYTFNPTNDRVNFGPSGDPDKWINFFHNNYQGPGPTNWEEENVSVSGGYLRMLNDREFNNGTPVMKSYQFGGQTITQPETRSACITASKRVIYPVFVEASLKVMNSSIASDVWLLSPDDTEEIDIIECYGGKLSDSRNAFFASRIHLSHHVFVRTPFLDYQPADWNSWYRRTGVSEWGGRDVRIGVYWKSPTIIEYYIDGELVRVLNNDAIASRLPDGSWEYTYPAGVTSTERNGALERVTSGSQTGFQAVTVASSLEEAKRLSEISVIDPFNYLENGRRFSKEMDIIINTEDQNWQAAAGRSPNNTEILNADDNTMLVDWIRVYKPEPMADRERSLSFDNKADYIEEGEISPTFSLGQIAEIDVTYATAITGSIEEDLDYIGAQIRQIDGGGTVIGVSDVVQPINGDQANASTTSFQYKIPSAFNDGTTLIPTSENLPTGHKLELYFSMPVDSNSDLIEVVEEITLIPSQIPDRTRFVSFDNVSDYIQNGLTLPTFEVGQTVDMKLSYATGISNGVEEDLNYVAVMVRQINETGQVVNTSAFNTAVLGEEVNADTVDYQFTIPNTFLDDTSIPFTDDLPTGHQLVLLIFMSVDNDSGFANGSENIEIVQQQPRARSITFDNVSNYIIPGGDTPTFDIGQTFDMTLTYATGVSASAVEEDLHYIATMLRQVDGNGATVKTSAFNTAVGGAAANSDTVTYQYTIPSTYNDGSAVLRTEDLPEGHKLVLLIFMSVDGDTGFANANQDITLALPGLRNRTITFDNRSDYVLEGETQTTFEIGQEIDMTISYSTASTGGNNPVEEDLAYIAVMLREVDGNGSVVNTSAFNTAVEGSASNFGIVNYQYTIPDTFNDNSPIPTTENLPEGHQLILLVFMSVDGDTGFVNANSNTIIVEEGELSVETISDNVEITSISPNPFNTTLHIGVQGELSWEMFDLQGKKVLEGYTTIVDGTTLNSGIYFLLLNGKEMIKVIKN